jgi:hypothetical protein
VTKHRWPRAKVEFDVPVYGGRCYLYRTHARYAAARRYLGHAINLTGTPPLGSFVHTQSRDGSVVYLVGWFDTDADTLVHEATHLCLAAFTTIDVDPRDSGGEPFCYFLESVLRKLRGED